MAHFGPQWTPQMASRQSTPSGSSCPKARHWTTPRPQSSGFFASLRPEAGPGCTRTGSGRCHPGSRHVSSHPACPAYAATSPHALCPHPPPQVLPVELPGNGSRMKDAKAGSMSALVDALLAAIAPLLEGPPFALLGHSLGAWVAFAAAQELQRRGGLQPLRLYVSGVRSAILAGPENDPDRLQMHRLEAPEFWMAMGQRYGRNPDLVSDFYHLPFLSPSGVQRAATQSKGLGTEWCTGRF